MSTPYANTPFVQRLRDQRDRLSHRKTQARIAEEMGYDKANNISNILYGRNALPFDRFPNAMEAFEIPTHEYGEYFLLAIRSYRDNKMWKPVFASLKCLTADQIAATLHGPKDEAA